MAEASGGVARFGLFELDLDRGELRRGGRLVPLQQHSLLILMALLERPGEEVSRETLRRRLWPEREFLDFENGLNTAVARLRHALGDAAQNPRFIGTRRGHGYRLLAPVSWVAPMAPAPSAGGPSPALLQAPAGASTTGPPPSHIPGQLLARRLRFGLVFLAAGFAVTLVLGRSRPASVASESASPPAGFELHPPVAERFTGSFALSPDGRTLAFVAGASARSSIWLRSLDGVTARPLEGTEGGVMPFWSPDGTSIGFFAGSLLQTLELRTGRIRSLAQARRGRGGTWTCTGLILFAPDVDSPILSVPALGGPATPVTDLAGAPSHRFPCALPDGRHFLYLVLREDRDHSEVWCARVGGTETARLLLAGSNALYGAPGYLVFARGASLLAQVFDADSLRVAGPPVVVQEHVDVYGEEGPTGLGAFSVSSGGDLATGEIRQAPSRFAWFDRHGRLIRAVGSPGDYLAFDLSPDAARLAAIRFDSRRRSSDVVTIDASSGVQALVTDDPWPDAGVTWAPTGTRVAFTSLRNGRWTAFVRDTTRAEPDHEVGACRSMEGWFPGGRHVLCERTAGRVSSLWKVPVAGGPAAPLDVTVGDESESRVSPDGRWLAYSADTGKAASQRDLRLVGLSRTPASTALSLGPGTSPRWPHHGRELFFIAERRVMTVSMRPGSAPGPADVIPLFEAPLTGRDGLADFPVQFCVSPDGLRFLFVVPAETTPPASIHVVPRSLGPLSADVRALVKAWPGQASR